MKETCKSPFNIFLYSTDLTATENTESPTERKLTVALALAQDQCRGWAVGRHFRLCRFENTENSGGGILPQLSHVLGDRTDLCLPYRIICEVGSLCSFQRTSSRGCWSSVSILKPFCLRSSKFTGVTDQCLLHLLNKLDETQVCLLRLQIGQTKYYARVCSLHKLLVLNIVKKRTADKDSSKAAHSVLIHT